MSSPSIDAWSRQTRFSDPGRYDALLAAGPDDIHGLAAMARNTITHYRAGPPLPPERIAEIDNRWVERILATHQARAAQPLTEPRPPTERVAGCCRDFTLLTVAALRQRGVAARSRVGFAAYFYSTGFHADHVIVDWWDGHRWVFTDAQLDPAHDWGFDPADMPRVVGDRKPGPFATAAQVWTAYRRGEIDGQDYGVDPDLPLRGGPFLRDYVIMELAHRRGDELLLWDRWGAGSTNPVGELTDDVGFIDEAAALLLRADDGDEAAEAELAERYARDERLHPGAEVICVSPTGVATSVDLVTRTGKEIDIPH
jgi:hypothetical protein